MIANIKSVSAAQLLFSLNKSKRHKSLLQTLEFLIIFTEIFSTPFIHFPRNKSTEVAF